MSLLEWMIGLSLACGLVLGLGQIYQSSQRHFIQDAQQNATDFEMASAEQLIRTHLQQAGFTPCGGFSSLQTPLNDHEILPQGIRWRRMSDVYTAAEVTGADRIRWSGDFQVVPQKAYLIADCYHAEKVLLQRVYRGEAQLTQLLKFDYQPPIFLGEYRQEGVYLAGTPAKLMVQSGEHAEVLSEAIKQLAVTPLISAQNRGVQFKIMTREGLSHVWKIRFRSG